MLEKDFIPVTVDKSHIITIGERLYTESIEFIRELINNAYDADATLVDVLVEKDRIKVSDNGTGMDRGGLIQYFNIGSQEKIYESKSPLYGRDRIGQFGIGKFASLAACESFEVITKKGDFAAKVVFDKKEWEKVSDNWSLPLEILSPDYQKENGTAVIINDLTRKFNLADIERRIIEGTPLKAPHFKVKLNGHTVIPRSLSGHFIPFLEGTKFGPVSGEVIILPETSASKNNLGIEVKVKQVTIKRALFGMETWGKAMARVRGEVYADFIPITSDRTGFIEDSPEYKEFLKTMEKVMEGVKGVLQQLSGRKEGRKASRALKEALQRVCKSLSMNPDLSPFGVLPIGGEGEGIGGAGLMLSDKKKSEIKEVKPAEEKHRLKEGRGKGKKPKVKFLTPNAIVQKIKYDETGVSCCIDSFGEDGPEAFSEETVIYINRDHSLYKREAKKKETHVLNMTRLLTQEISLMKNPRNPRHAFDRQSMLLRDAFKEDQ
jgi:hypothetical protein